MKTKQLAQVFLLGNALLAAGCATIGSKLDLQLAQEAEMKGCEETYQGKGISLDDCKLISEVIKEMTTDATGKYGFVGYDSDGKIKLKGSYQDEEAIERAFMVAATVVGVDKVGVSDVTPRELGRIKMTKSYVIPTDTGGKPKKYALLIGVSKFQDSPIYKNVMQKDGKIKKTRISGITDIESAAKDVDVIADTLEGLEQKNGFENENITVIKDKDATKANILAAMRDLASKVTSKDTVVFYISTHGTPPNQYGKTGIIPYDMAHVEYIDKDVDLGAYITHGKGDKGTGAALNKDKNTIKRIATDRARAIESAISFDDLQNFMTSIKTNKFIAILDTCFSGSALEALTKPIKAEYAAATKKFVSNYSEKDQKALIDSAAQSCNTSDYDPSQVKVALEEAFSTYKRENADNTAGSKSLINEDNETSGQSTDYETVAILKDVQQQIEKKRISKRNYEFEQYERLKIAYGASASESQNGRVLITATSGNEESWFHKEVLPNSFFTYYFVRGLEKNNGQIFKAFDYAQFRTRLLALEDVGKNQTPQMTSTPAACANINLSK